jgi:hypothetical protein
LYEDLLPCWYLGRLIWHWEERCQSSSFRQDNHAQRPSLIEKKGNKLRRYFSLCSPRINIKVHSSGIQKILQSCQAAVFISKYQLPILFAQKYSMEHSPRFSVDCLSSEC